MVRLLCGGRAPTFIRPGAQPQDDHSTKTIKTSEVLETSKILKLCKFKYLAFWVNCHYSIPTNLRY